MSYEHVGTDASGNHYYADVEELRRRYVSVRPGGGMICTGLDCLATATRRVAVEGVPQPYCDACASVLIRYGGERDMGPINPYQYGVIMRDGTPWGCGDGEDGRIRQRMRLRYPKVSGPCLIGEDGQVLIGESDDDPMIEEPIQFVPGLKAPPRRRGRYGELTNPKDVASVEEWGHAAIAPTEKPAQPLGMFPYTP